MKLFFWICLCGLLVFPPTSLAAEEIELLLAGNPEDPNSTGLGQVYDLYLGRLEQALAENGDSFIVRQLPIARISREIEKDETASCAFAWNHTPERQKIGKFSGPLWVSLPIVALAREEAGLSNNYEHIKDLVFDREKLGGITGFTSSVPGYIRSLLNQYEGEPSLIEFPIAYPELLGLVEMGRVHYILISEKVAEAFLAQSKTRQENFHIVYFGNLTKPEARSLFCTFSTSNDLIDRFNTVYAELFPDFE